MPAVDLADAVLQTLRASPVAAAFGDTWDPTAQTGVQKFFGDFAYAPGEPYLVLREPREDRQYFTRFVDNSLPFIAPGVLQATIHATGREQARSLGAAVAAALNDQVPSWTGADLMMFRAGPSGFVPTPATGPDTPTVFVYAVTFNYMYSGHI